MMANSRDASFRQPRRDSVVTLSRRGDESRRRILDTALGEFGRAGFRGATTRRIAERSGTTLPALRYYFGDKAGLYRACVEEMIARYGRKMAAAVKGTLRTIDAGPGDAGSGPDAAREALKDLIASSVRLILGSEAYAVGSGIIARELAEPGPGFDLLYDHLWLPGIERSARLISRIRSEPEVSDASRMQAILLIASIPSLHTRRAVAQRAMAWTEMGQAELAVIIAVLHRQIDGI